MGEGVTQYSDIANSVFYTDDLIYIFIFINHPTVSWITFSYFNEYQNFANDFINQQKRVEMVSTTNITYSEQIYNLF